VHRIQAVLPQRYEKGRPASHSVRSVDAQSEATLHPVSVEGFARREARAYYRAVAFAAALFICALIAYGGLMTTRREFLSGLAAAGLATQPAFREHGIRSLFRANAI